MCSQFLVLPYAFGFVTILCYASSWLVAYFVYTQEIHLSALLVFTACLFYAMHA